VRVDNKAVEIIPPEAYPQVMPRAESEAFIQVLTSQGALARADRVVAEQRPIIGHAIAAHVSGLKSAFAAGDLDAAHAEAHEIRGLAGNAGFAAAGSISDKFCKYLDGTAGKGVTPDPLILRLHVEAIARATQARDEADRFGRAVAAELDALVAQRLAAKA
jgi:HPt (histidine-containing phosphotransfer) domain-containing protein